jgi:hypothetical protein
MTYKDKASYASLPSCITKRNWVNDPYWMTHRAERWEVFVSHGTHSQKWALYPCYTLSVCARVRVYVCWKIFVGRFILGDFCLARYTFSKSRSIPLLYGTPHEKLLGIQRVSNPYTENQRISTPAHSNGYKWDMHVSAELRVQIKHKGVYGVENPLPRSFLGGFVVSWTFEKYFSRKAQISRKSAL